MAIYVDNSPWKVSEIALSIAGAKVLPPSKDPWVFTVDPVRAGASDSWPVYRTGHVHAGSVWTGSWKQMDDCSIDVTIKLTNGSTSSFRVVFVSRLLFAAIPPETGPLEGFPYRIGRASVLNP